MADGQRPDERPESDPTQRPPFAPSPDPAESAQSTPPTPPEPKVPSWPESDAPTVPVHYEPPPASQTADPAQETGAEDLTFGAVEEPAGADNGGWSTQQKILAGCGGLLAACVLLALCTGIGVFVADYIDEDPTATAIADQPTETAANTATAEPTTTPAPTNTIEPTNTTEPTSTASETATLAPSPTETQAPTPTLASQDLVILEVGAGQDSDGQEVGWSFIVQNPDTSQGIERSEYTVLLKDAAGTVIDSDSGFISFIFPGETLGVSGAIFLEEGLEASTIEVEVISGEPTDAPEGGGFTVSQVTYYPDEFFPTVTGLVENPFDVSFNDLRISVIPYDADGNIVGGGFTFMDVAPAEGSAGVEVNFTSSQEPAQVVVYATLSGLSEAHEPAPTDIVVNSMGFGQDGSTVGWAAILQNPNQDMLVDTPVYQVTFLDAEGRVAAVDANSLVMILGGETLGVASDLVFLPDGVQVAQIQVDVLTGELAPDTFSGRFSYSDMQYVADEFFPRVTGVVTSPFDQQLEDLNAFAVLYDEAGNIIGGGRSFMDPLPPGGQTLADVPVTGSSTPAAVELYVTFSFLTEF